MPSLFDKRLLIFSGKGGAGKSTVAAATAVAAARRGKRVIIVEIGEQERIPAIFGAGPAGYAGARVYSGGTAAGGLVWSMCLTARETLHEFAVRSMKFEVLYQAVFENRAMRYFTAAAPGLDELTIMGKIEHFHRESLDTSRAPRFDLMVFDAPATGHGLAFFKVPLTAMSMARMGPLHAKAERMWRLLADPVRTAFNIVTLPEEMSVNESIDLHASATKLGLPRGKLVVNAVYPDAFGDRAPELQRLHEQARPSEGPAGRIARAALDRARSSVARYEAHQAMIGTLAAALPQERVVLPFLFRPRIGVEEIEALATSLDSL
jgi:anion-transporting  ArsA/GET3 family ATPase